MFTFSLLLHEERGLSTLASSPFEGFPCSISLSFHCIHIYLGRFLSPLHDVSRFGDCKMSTVDNPHIADTESEDRRRRRQQRRRRNPSVARSSDQGTEGSLCFSDSDEQSRHSPFGSTAGGSYDDECRFSGESVSQIEGVSDPERNSLSSDVDLESGILEVKVRLAKVEKECRICKMSWVSGNPESGIPIELGCSCKEDLAAAHKQCAETWFRIKGNTTCEICGATALNVASEQTNESSNATAAAAATAAPEAPAIIPETRRLWHGRRIMNFLLACMVFAFVISWLFHFNVLS